MTEIIKDAQKSENSAIENLVVEYQAAARKSCRSILEVAKCVQRARTVLAQNGDYHVYLQKIVVSESYAKKLQTIAKQAIRIEEHLSRIDVDLSFDALYQFAQLSEDDLAKTNVLQLRTAKDFAAANTAKAEKAETKKAVQAIKEAKKAIVETEAVAEKSEVVEVDFTDLDFSVLESKAEAVFSATASNADAYVLNVSRLSSEKQTALYEQLIALKAKYDFAIEVKAAEAFALAA
jgi:hypothetical protein